MVLTHTVPHTEIYRMSYRISIYRQPKLLNIVSKKHAFGNLSVSY